jgi:hypothetical protein
MTAHHALSADMTIIEQFASSHCGVTSPSEPMMRRSRIDLGENHDPGRIATDRQDDFDIAEDKSGATRVSRPI